MCVTKGRDILRNKAYAPNKKNGYTWQPAPQDERQLYIKGCSCGWCYECRQKDANQWRVRLKEEVKGNQFKNMIFATFTFSEEEYSKLAKEVRGDIIKQYGEVQGDIDNEIAAKASPWRVILSSSRPLCTSALIESCSALNSVTVN